MSTQSLIAELTMQARPRKRLPHMRICAEWMTITLLSFAAIGWLYGFRPDLSAKLAEPWFMLEMAMNAMLVLVAGCSATAFSYPDRAKATFLKPMLAMIFMGYSLITLMTVFNEPNLASEVASNARHGLECLLCIVSFAAIPAIWMFWRLRQLASTKPMQAGGAALMMAVAAGCLGIRLVETEMESAGMVIWHYLPLLVLSGLGLILGKRIFKW
jgi:hypothetical protein